MKTINKVQFLDHFFLGPQERKLLPLVLMNLRKKELKEKARTMQLGDKKNKKRFDLNEEEEYDRDRMTFERAFRELSERKVSPEDKTRYSIKQFILENCPERLKNKVQLQGENGKDILANIFSGNTMSKLDGKNEENKIFKKTQLSGKKIFKNDDDNKVNSFQKLPSINLK